MFLNPKEEHKAQFSLLLLCQCYVLSVPSLRDPSPPRVVSQLPCQILGQLILAAQSLFHGNLSKLVSSPYLQCDAYALPHTKKSKPAALQDLPISVLTPAPLPHLWLRSLWRTLATCSCAPCRQVLHLRAELYSLLVPALLFEITATDPVFGGHPYCHFTCSLHASHFSWSELESIVPHVDSSSVIVLYREQIALLVCAFILPGY